MTNREDRVQISAEIPVETNEALEAAKQRHDQPKWEKIDEALRLYLGLEAAPGLAGIERRIQRLEEKRDNLLEERDTIDEEIKAVEDEIEHARAERERLKQKRATYREELDEILDALEANPTHSVYAYRDDLRAAATIEYGESTEETLTEVVSDLRQRADENDADVRAEQFEIKIGPQMAVQEHDGAQSSDDGLRFEGVTNDG